MRHALILIVLFLSACHAESGYLIRINDSVSGKSGYANMKGDTVIPLGKYLYCYSDTFKNYAIVSTSKIGIIGINRNQQILYKVFIFDNGPDYVSEGYFRITGKNKMGYADTLGNIAITPAFGCAFPFDKGVAKVSYKCRVVNADDEHSSWESDNWFYIDKTGKRVK